MRKILLAVVLTMVHLPAFAGCPSWTIEAPEGSRYAQRFARASQYLPTVLRVLAEEGLGAQWVYLMLAESGGKHDAVSGPGAGGLWQLMPATAMAYGCGDVLDVECSTLAAARYLTRLIREFKTVKDVVAAYNMGGHNFRRLGRPTAQAVALAHEVACLVEHDPLNLIRNKELIYGNE